MELIPERFHDIVSPISSASNEQMARARTPELNLERISASNPISSDPTLKIKLIYQNTIVFGLY